VRIHPLGDAALVVELGDRVDIRLNERARDLADRLRRVTGVEDAVASYCGVTVYYEPEQVSYSAIHHLVLALSPRLRARAKGGRLHEIPVVYGGAELEETAAQLGLEVAALVKMHSDKMYNVFLIGFLPGQPYLGPLPARLQLPRAATPRARVPAGSVAIAGRQTIVYPWASPSGWHVLGHTSVLLFHPNRHPPALLRAGDRVRFVPT
jgi:inhibitor of KinA